MNGSRTLLSLVIVITSAAIWFGVRSPMTRHLMIDSLVEGR